MSSRYAVKDIYNSLQCEGRRAGKRSVFVRFAGCNLWEGTALSRARSDAPCALWCDADFHRGQVLSLDALLLALDDLWPSTGATPRWCVLTGGEPMLHLDRELLDALHAAGWMVAVETNGTIESALLGDVDWVTVSPKHGVPLAVARAHELRVVLPGVAPSQTGGWADDELLSLADSGRWGALYVVPQDVLLGDAPGKTALVDCEDADEETQQLALVALHLHLQRAIDFVMAHPEWALCPQAHKLLGIQGG
jgi:organic radical activating enzyme